MKLQLQRETETPACTMGELTIEGIHTAWTLERPGPQFAADFHRIPAGTYKIGIYPSPHFQRNMPLLLDVPGHSGIEIHWGNYPLDSKGCILIGKTRGDDAIWNTREMFDELFPQIQAACEAEGCEIEVLDILTNRDAVQDAAAT